MDQIMFMYTRELIIEATLEQYEKPQSRLLSGYAIAEGILQVERLVKPAAFTIQQNLNGGKRRLNLNDLPIHSLNRAPRFGPRTNVPL